MLAYIIQNNIFPKWANRSGGGTIDDFSNEQLVNHCKDIYQSYLFHLGKGFGIKGKNVIEVGPGRSLGVSLSFASLGGANRVYAVDRFNCLSRYDNTVLKSIDPEHENYLKKIVYIVSPIEDLAGSDIGKVDLIVSNAVLEHINNLEQAFKTFHSLLSPAGRMIHKIDIRSHNRFIKKGPLYFLKYSDFLWKMMSNHIGAPNRMRLPDYKAILDRSGFDFEFIVEDYYDLSEVRRAKETLLKKVRFGSMSTEDLSVSTFWLIAKPRL